jgi:hypothetical protein
LKYYCDLIRIKQLIVFTFVPIDDYNLVSIKILSFLLQLSLYISINALFFTDSTMHQIYTNNGKLDLKYHIPQIVYSSLISTFINAILRILSLSEGNILLIKQEKSLKMSAKLSIQAKFYIKVKFFLFFIASFLLCGFFWYFLACFCAVYKNTQIILIKDSFISFNLSMLYPFGIYLIPGCFRIPALRAKNKDKKMMYKIGFALSLI